MTEYKEERAGVPSKHTYERRMKLKPFDECEECGFWLGEEDGDCCEFSLTNDPCPILNIEIDNFYEENLDEEENESNKI